MAPATRAIRKPYRVFLNTALHRRFIRACILIVIVCYAEAIILGEKNSWLWTWFPFGIAGFRTSILFTSCLCILVRRVLQMHIGKLNTASPFDTFLYFLFRLDTLWHFFWSLFAALLFSEVCLWSAPPSANLSWIIPGTSYGRAKLNERPIFLRSLLYILASVEAIWYLLMDESRIPIPVTVGKPEEASDQGTHDSTSRWQRIIGGAITVTKLSAVRMGIVFVIGPVIYIWKLRWFAWKYTLFWAKLFHDLPRSQSEPSGIPPCHIYLIIRAVFSAFLLSALWGLCNVAFIAFVSEKPLKSGQPLSAPSKDPNGTLLEGLRAKSEMRKTFAFWELMLISHDFPDRRKSVYDELDREGGSTWSQILDASLSVIEAIPDRIYAFETRAVPRDPLSKDVEIQKLPQLLKPLKEDNIDMDPPKPKRLKQWVGMEVNRVVKSYGNSPDWTPTVRRRAIDMIPEQAKVVTAEQIAAAPGWIYTKFLLSPLGWPFRKTFSRYVSSILLGYPFAELSPIVDAIDSITRLLICSLKEDKLGKVQEDVPLVVKTFTFTIQRIQGLVKSIAPHGTDLYFDGNRSMQDVDLVLNCLEQSLADLLGAFSLYLEDVGVVGDDLEAAKKCASPRTQEMTERK